MKVLVTKPILDELEKELSVKFTNVVGPLSSSGNFFEIHTEHVNFFRILKRKTHEHIRAYQKKFGERKALPRHPGAKQTQSRP